MQDSAVLFAESPVRDQYTYHDVVFHKSGSAKHAIGKLASVGKKALFAMFQRCSDLCSQDVPHCFHPSSTCSVLWL